MAIVRLILLLGICVTGFVTIECQDCSNGAGYCDYSTTSLYCYITSNDTQSIKALLRDCSSNSASFTYIYVYKNYVSNEFGNLLIDIELPSNIEYLRIFNHQDQDQIRLTTSNQNIALTRLYTSYHIELESNDFFTHFTGLQHIYMSYVLSTEPPSFTNLHSLSFLKIHLVGPVSHPLDDRIVSGLTNLSILYLHNSYFNGITKAAFRNLNMLTYLFLENNELAYIEDGALTELSSLKVLYLHNNGIQIVSDNLFEGLTDLTFLYLNDNPGFPPNALIQARSVTHLYLQYNEYHTLDPYPFQQMDSLRYLYLSDPFVCGCELQWISLAGQFGIYIQSAVCTDLSDPFPRSKSITDQELYTNCSQTESLQCFNKSITCSNNLVCHNTEDNSFCGCSRGYSLHSSGECKDIDECDETTDCQQKCQNTKGSFHCTCDEGYELTGDGYSCDDINECQEWNGGCEFGCRNTIGSYQCYCEYGHELYNETSCFSDIECDIVDSNEVKNSESRFTCEGGFHLSVSNLSSQSGEISGAIVSTSLLLGIAVVIIIIQVIVIFVIVIVFLQKIQSIKANGNIVTKGPESQPEPSKTIDSGEQTYYDISELPLKTNPVQVPKSRYQQDTNTRKYTQLPGIEPYPVQRQGDLEEYANLK